MELHITPKFKIGDKVTLVMDDEVKLKLVERGNFKNVESAENFQGYIESITVKVPDKEPICLSPTSMINVVMIGNSHIIYRVYKDKLPMLSYAFFENELLLIDDTKSSDPAIKEIIDKTMDEILSTKVVEYIDQRIKSIESTLESSFTFFMKRSADIYAEKVFSNYEEKIKSLFEDVIKNDEKYNDGFLSIRNGIQSGLRTAAEKYINNNYEEVKNLVKPVVIDIATTMARKDFSSMIQERIKSKIILKEILKELKVDE